MRIVAVPLRYDWIEFVAREGGDTLSPFTQIAPELVQVLGSGKTSSSTDDRDVELSAGSCAASTLLRPPIGIADTARVGHPILEKMGKQGNRRVLEQLEHRHFDIELFLNFEGRPERGKRGASKFEKVVMNANRRDAEHLAPNHQQGR